MPIDIVMAHMCHFLLSASSGLAYLDGGTGSMMLQAALASLLAVPFVIKSRWAQLRAFIATRSRKHDDQP